jgi:hypothetical protein
MYTPWPISSSGKKLMHLCEISGFCHGVVEVFALLGCYAALAGGHSPTIWDSLSFRIQWSKAVQKETSYPYFCFVFHLHILIFRKTCPKHLFLFMNTCVKGIKIVSLENVMPCHAKDMIWYCLAKLLQTWTCCSP